MENILTVGQNHYKNNYCMAKYLSQLCSLCKPPINYWVTKTRNNFITYSKTKQQAGLSNSRITNKKQLEQVVANNIQHSDKSCTIDNNVL